jgi:hypothetical protein
MQPLAALERFFERLFERPSARLFGARLQPVQLLRRVERAMETGRHTTSEGVLVPDRFAVRLNPTDLEALGDSAGDLASELADGALRFARAHGYRLRTRPRVALVGEPRVAAGDLEVQAGFGVADGDPGVWSVPPPDALTREPLEGPVSESTVVYRPPTVSGPMARLRVLDPTGADRGIVLDGGVVTIGRGPENTVVLGDRRVSRHHARLHARQGTLVLVDLGSSNGTLVNGVPIQEVALGIGDEIRIGDTRLLVEPLAV